MKSVLLLGLSVLLVAVSTVSALKEGECEGKIYLHFFNTINLYTLSTTLDSMNITIKVLNLLVYLSKDISLKIQYLISVQYT